MDTLLLTHLSIGPLMVIISAIFFFFPPKKINHLYGHRTTMSTKNQDTWNEANKRSAMMFLWVSLLTCFVQASGIVLNLSFDTTVLITCIFLVVGLIAGVLYVEYQLRSIFDKEGQRR